MAKKTTLKAKPEGDAPVVAVEGTPLQDFLEKYVADGVRREQTLEEGVWRSIPAFLITLGVIGAVLAFSVQHLAVGLRDPLGLLGLAFAVAGAAAVVIGGFRLSTAVRSRGYVYPADELFTVESADALRRQYEYDGVAPGLAEARALAEKRREVLMEWAASASNNQLANKRKAAARAASAQWMFVAAACAILAGSAALFVDAPRAEPDRTPAPQVVMPTAAAAKPVEASPPRTAPAPRPERAAEVVDLDARDRAWETPECSDEPVWPRRLSSRRNDCATTSAGGRRAG